VTGIRFASKIHIVPMAQFERLPLRRLRDAKLYVGSPWLADQRIREAEEGDTDLAWGCNTGGITNGQKLGMYHLTPIIMDDPNNPNNNWSWAYTANKLIADAQKLKDAGARSLRGLHTGGRTHYHTSPPLRDKLREFYKCLGIPCSMIWGQREIAGNGERHVWTNLYGSAPLDTWVITTKEGPEIRNMADLKDHFEQVEIADGDELIFGGTPVIADDRLVDIT
jgi:hypothetical protein